MFRTLERFEPLNTPATRKVPRVGNCAVMSFEGSLDALLKKLIPHIGKESFYELL
jgi:hypothetical protein